MSVLQSFTASLDAIRRNPILLAVGIAVGLLQLPSLAAAQFDPLVSSLVSLGSSVVTLLVVPFVFAGAIGLSAAALDGEARLDTLIEAGKRNYVTVLAAYLLLLVGFGVFFGAGLVVIAILAAVVAFGGAGLAASAIVIPIALIATLLLLVPLLFVQFFAHAIVLDDQGITDSFRRSAGLVRRNLVTVAGYAAILLVLSMITGSVGGVASLAGTPAGASLSLPTLSTPAVIAVQAVTSVLTGLVTAVFWPFSVAVYRSIRDRTLTDGSAGQATPA